MEASVSSSDGAYCSDEGQRVQRDDDDGEYLACFIGGLIEYEEMDFEVGLRLEELFQFWNLLRLERGVVV
jgi:hypothetical protein